MSDAGNKKYSDELGPAVHAEYMRLGEKEVRSFTLPEFKEVLLSFYDFTLEAYIFGNLKRPDGTSWKTRSEALDTWAALHKFSDHEVYVFFRANDNIQSYS